MGERSSERLRRGALPFDKKPHGTVNGYINYMCRCDACKAAKAAKGREERAQRWSDPDAGEKARHGTPGAYSGWGCRCPDCLAAHSASKTRRRLAANDATRKKAQRAWTRWTGPELEVATRPDLTAREAASALGRSYISIERARARCLHDPRYMAMLGAAHAGIGE